MDAYAQLLLLDNESVEFALQTEDVLGAVREAFVLHSQGAGRVFPVIREKLHTGGVFGIKAGDVAGQNLLGFKAGGFWPSNRQTGSEPHQATILLINPATGRPQVILDGNAITTARTGAAGALGLKTFAREDSERLCLFGTGVQAHIQLTYALSTLPNLHDVQYVSASGEPEHGFEAQFRDRCTIRVARDRNDAVALSDVVITATPGRQQLFDSTAMQAGTHLTCVGADTAGKRELPPNVLERARVFVDDRQQAQSIGECQWVSGIQCTEIGDVLVGKVPFQREYSDITVFDMTGLALQDLTVARLVYQSAISSGKGRTVAWPW
ncbi:ornithine cyclodeaminase [Paraburkholderia tropica]|uniref:Ornithine cyclodeaminase n=1 Tax=Paraburkholderia tropica TaxID=92647 RepID=A0ABX5MDQ7_9BURK|nr:ornithine cyclodeaminase family protein [Paraburkholderia tropica]MBB3005031.1 ornithine cyclodeaminase [Paraburkholderia tropica]MBB6324032.1 ornithine cyclodeaminase [Paraburkholderia tropica]PXX06170.1 ornithine cyclodeaminase [Paraburkholderia tropica]PZW72027.1 ornithine cyclodeaminase [Paraburkholderia tropica]